jgi:hypothetical protein
VGFDSNSANGAAYKLVVARARFMNANAIARIRRGSFISKSPHAWRNATGAKEENEESERRIGRKRKRNEKKKLTSQ